MHPGRRRMTPTDVYIAFGQIDYETADTLGVELELATAQEMCETHRADGGDTPYDRYRIQQWGVGAAAPTREWVRAAGGDWRAA